MADSRYSYDGMRDSSVAEPRPAPPPRNPARLDPSARLGIGIVALAFAVATVLTWRKWPDALVDFGMQLYLPWKISQGMVLYRDAKYLTGGPFSQYFNALLFKTFGVSLMTLAVTNLLIAAGLIALMFRRFLKAADTLTTSMICLAVVLVFAFGQYSDIANYNFITPYSHEVWHGVALSIAAVALLASWAAKEKVYLAACAGFCAGIVFMTKPDVFVALAAAVVAAMASVAIAKRDTGFLLKSLLAMILSGVIAPLLFLFYFHAHEGWREALRSVCFAWVPLIKSNVSETPFYKWCTGMDAPWLNARAMLVQFAVVCGFVAASAFVFRRDLMQSKNRLLAIGWVALTLALASRYEWVDCGRSLPLLDAVLLVVLGLQFLKTRDVESVFPLLWSVFALVLLVKLGLYSRIWHYGFALAMPAFMAAIYLLLWTVPQWLAQYRVDRKWFRGAIALVLLTGMARLFVQSQFVFHSKTVAVGNGADRFFAPDAGKNPAGAGIQSALEWLEQNTPQDATLAVLPEGVMLNYLARRTNPTHYLLWNGNDLTAFGQAEMTADFEAHPPDYVVLVHRDASEYGTKYFGQEARFGLDLMNWIKLHYEPVKLIGSEPLVNSSFGVKILRRVPNAK